MGRAVKKGRKYLIKHNFLSISFIISLYYTKLEKIDFENGLNSCKNVQFYFKFLRQILFE